MILRCLRAFALFGATLLTLALLTGAKTTPRTTPTPAVKQTKAHSQTKPPSARQWKGRLVIGSKQFTENRILAELMAQLIEARLGIKVVRKLNLSGTLVAFTALKSGEIDIYPEYTGTGWNVQFKIKGKVSDPLRAYVVVRALFSQKHQLGYLLPFGFSNSYGVAMSEKRAQALGIRTISDLHKHSDKLRIGFSHEFIKRKDGYPGLSKAYGFQWKVRGLDHGLAYKAILTNKLDVVDTWTTDGKLLRYKMRTLKDDRGFFPPYHAAPLVREAALKKYPGLRKTLNLLAYRLPDRKMQALNLKVEDGASSVKVVQEFLKSEGLLKASAILKTPVVERNKGLWSFVRAQAPQTKQQLLRHLWLTLIAVLLAILFSVPLGIGLTRSNEKVAQFVIRATGVLQTIPSLALLAFLIPIPGLGLGMRSAILALFLYALLPIVRNTYTGIREVDPHLLEAAQGIGLTNLQILWHVELPLAVRTIMAGIRTATVISVGVATLAAFIGAGGLGDPIVMGLNLSDTRLILSGAIPAALLAILVDWVLGLLEEKLSPVG
jgi:osmoprotectant transport system permease protein